MLQQNSVTVEHESQDNNQVLYDTVVVLAMLLSLGFPGNYATKYGSFLTTIVEYGIFLAQIVVMLMPSSKKIGDVNIIDVSSHYTPIYQYLLVLSITSMAVTRFPKEQIISCIRFSILAFFAIWMVDRYKIKRILELLYIALIIYLILTLLSLVLMPELCYSNENGTRNFTGLFTTKNPLGEALAFSMAMQILLWRLKIEEKEKVSILFIAVLVLQLVILFAANATGSIFTAAIPVAYIILVEPTLKKTQRLHFHILYIVVSVGFLFIAMNILPLFAPFLEAIGKDATLTGRTPMWEQFINVMTHHNTLTGFGLFMYWRDDVAIALFHNAFDAGTWGATMTFGAHNTLLELWLDTGLIGLISYFLMIIFSLHNPQDMEEDAYLLCSVYISVLMIKGLTERSFTTANYSSLFLFLTLGYACKSRNTVYELRTAKARLDAAMKREMRRTAVKA